MTIESNPEPGRIRLRAVAGCVPPGSRVADVGSDHGLLPQILLAERRALACVATEQRPGGPLDRLVGCDPRLVVRFGDGLAALETDDRVDVVVLGGMGARAIVRILERGRDRLADVTRLVLQPQSEWPRLRAWLRDNGFRIADERLVCERGRFYLVLVAEPAAEPAAEPGADPGAEPGAGLTREDVLEAGPVLLRTRPATAVAYWRERLDRAERAERDKRASRAGGGTGAATAGGPEQELQRARRILACLGN